MTLYITFASCQIYWVFKEVEIQLKLYATEKEERKKEKCWFCILFCQEDLEFEGGETMWYEAKKLRVMPVRGEIGRVRTAFFFFFFFGFDMHLPAEIRYFIRFGQNGLVWAGI